jgi:hypothetical protein
VTRSTLALVLALLGNPAPVDLESRAVILQPASALPAWMAGCWSGTRDGERFHERWTQADGSTLLGVSHTVKGGKLTAFEFLRVILKDGRAVYVAQPGGVPPTEFVATSMTAGRVVFENAAHDFPKRVLYERSGADGLTAAIDGGASSKQRVEFAMTREACGKD